LLVEPSVVGLSAQYTLVMHTACRTSHLDHSRLFMIAALTGVLVSGLAGCTRRATVPPPASAPATPQTDDREAVLLFRKAVENYALLHRRLSKSLPTVSAQASPAEIHAQEVAFEKAIAAERKSNGSGDLFIPQIQPLIRRVAKEKLSGQAGAPLLETIKEESTEGRATARVNARYPDNVPLSSVPAQLLEALPPLPEELEYRFVGRDLILLDTKARLVADVMPAVLPR
jgi:hypothetical protein